MTDAVPPEAAVNAGLNASVFGHPTPNIGRWFADLSILPAETGGKVWHVDCHISVVIAGAVNSDEES